MANGSLLEMLLHGGPELAGWRTAEIHAAILAAFGLTIEHYSLSQLRYDLRKLKAHGLLERIDRGYAYRLTEKGIRIGAMFILYHKRVCGPLANSLYHHRPENRTPQPGKNRAGLSPSRRGRPKADRSARCLTFLRGRSSD